MQRREEADEMAALKKKKEEEATAKKNKTRKTPPPTPAPTPAATEEGGTVLKKIDASKRMVPSPSLTRRLGKNEVNEETPVIKKKKKIKIPPKEQLYADEEDFLDWELEGEIGEIEETDPSPSLVNICEEDTDKRLGLLDKWLEEVSSDFQWRLARAAADMTLRQNLANQVPLELSFRPASLSGMHGLY